MRCEGVVWGVRGEGVRVSDVRVRGEGVRCEV